MKVCFGFRFVTIYAVILTIGLCSRTDARAQTIQFDFSVPDTVLSVDSLYAGSVVATDENGIEISVTLISSPAGANWDSQTQEFEWTPSEPELGVFRFRAEDSSGGSAIAERVALAQGSVFDGVHSLALRDALDATYSPTQTLGDAGARDSLFAVVFRDPDNHVPGIYTQFEAELTEGDPSTVMLDAGIDVEHLWPQSFGAGDEPQKSDLYNLAPAKTNVRSSRGNKSFRDIDDVLTENWYYLDMVLQSIPQENIDSYSESAPGAFEPREDVKGDVARANLYFYAIWKEFADMEYIRNSSNAMLLDWPLQDKVSVAEARRAAKIASWQGNVNPFLFDSTLGVRMLSTPPQGVEEQFPSDISSMKVYPNPAGRTLFVQLDPPVLREKNCSLSIFDLLGRRVRYINSEFGVTFSHEIDIASLAGGVYAVQSSCGETLSNMLFIKRR